MINNNDNRIRQIVREEIARSASSNRFNLSSIPNHAHTGTDSSPQIKAENVIPSASITGSVTFAQATTYTLQLNASFTPRNILAYGIATGTLGGNQARVQTIGSAQLTPTFYLQDPTSANTPDTYVVTGNLQFPFNGVPAQSSSFIYVTRGGTSNFFAGNSEDHIASIFHGTSVSDIDARATVTGFSKNEITIDVPILTAGWELTLNFVIT